MKRIFIAGCGGMLGDAMYHVLKDDYILKCTDKEITDTYINYLDFRNFSDYKKSVEEFKADYLFHIGAYTDLEWCEQNIDETYLNNTLSVENAVRIANSMNIPLVYISTAGIFDGSQNEYNDWDIPNPLSIYGKSKYYAERYVVENANKYLVLRAGWMMGGGPNKDKKFVQKIMKQIKEGKKEIFAVTDKFGTPTYTFDFVKTLKTLLEKEYWGLYNCTCSGSCSRFDVAKEIINILDLEHEIKLTPVDSSFFERDYFANRPYSEELVTKKIDILGVSSMRDWKVSLTEYINKDYKDYLNE